MSLGAGPIVGGMVGAMVVLPILALAMVRATPRTDFVADLASDEIVVAQREPVTVHGTLALESETHGIHAYLDGLPAPMTWTGRDFDVQLPEVRPGAHLLSLGRRYGGGIERTIAVPVVTGPFANRGDWIDGAVEIWLSPHQIDDRNAGTDRDLAGALRTYIRDHVTEPTPLGLLEDCPVNVDVGVDANSVVLAGTAYFQHGGVRFRVGFRFSQVGPQHLALSATSIEAEPDSNALIYAHHGVGASIVSAFSRGFTGNDTVVAVARRRTQANFEEIVRAFLPRLNDAMQIPGSIDLDESLRGVSAGIRFHGPPRFLPGGAMSIRFDVRFVGARANDRGRGPLQLEPVPNFVPDGHAHLRLSSQLTAAALDVFSGTGGLESALNAALRAVAQSDGTMHLDDFRVASPGVFQSGAGGAPEWILPDLQIDAHGDARALHREIHAFVAGTFDASLRADHAAVVLVPRVDAVALNCHEHPASGLRFVPCMSDVVTAGLDVPALINRNIAGISLFGTTLDRVARVRIVGAIPIAIDVHSLVIDRTSGQPVMDLASEVAFEERGSVHPTRARAHTMEVDTSAPPTIEVRSVPNRRAHGVPVGEHRSRSPRPVAPSVQPAPAMGHL